MSIKARSTAATRSDRRSQKRQTMVLRVGLLEAGSRTAFCLVKNISPEGVQVKLYGSLLPDCDVSLKVGDENGTGIVVNEGLGGGEQVIVEGLQGVKPGVPVTAHPVQQALGRS